MKIQYASDFHLEFAANTSVLAAAPLRPVGDVLLLAGDMHLFGLPDCERHPFWDWCADHFEQTYAVPGNHEYYGGHPLDDTLADFEWALRPNVRYVNNRVVALAPNIDLLATTLWSRIPPQDEMMCNQKMTDFHRIVYGGQPFRACHYGEVHDRCLAWLTAALQASQAAHKVVLTHHCPAIIEDPRYQSNGLSRAFVNPLEHYVELSGADAWLFGHTHYNGGRGIILGSTTLLVNQFGYTQEGELPNFDRSAVVEL